MSKRLFGFILIFALGGSLLGFDFAVFEPFSNEEGKNEACLFVTTEDNKIQHQDQALELLKRNQELASVKNGLIPLKNDNKFDTSLAEVSSLCRTKKYDIGNDSYLEVGVLLKVRKNSWGKAEILSVKDKWATIKGKSAKIAFKEIYLTDLTTSYPSTYVWLKGRGSISHEVGLLDFNVKSDLKSLDYNYTKALELKKHFSKTINFDFVISP